MEADIYMRRSEEDISNTFRARISLDEEVGPNDEFWKGSKTRAPFYGTGFYLFGNWVQGVYLPRQGIKNWNEIIYKSGQLGEPLIYISHCEHLQRRVQPFIDMGWIGEPNPWLSDWRSRLEVIIKDLQLTDYQAMFACSSCGWHLISPNPYPDRVIPLEYAVHEKGGYHWSQYVREHNEPEDVVKS